MANVNQTRTRSVCFTLNNFRDDEILAIEDMLSNHLSEHSIKFAGFGEEVGEEGTPHLQGFLYFSSAKSFSAIHKLPGLSRCHFETIKGSVEQNIKYCSKEGHYQQFGVAPQQGKRSDLDEVVELVKSGKRISDVAADCPVQFVKFHKGIERLLALHLPARSFKTEVFWFYGPTGTGKSKKAFDLAFEASTYYVKPPTTKWWDGYEQQDVVVIDDYRPDFCTFACLLRLLDRYPMTVEMKGATTQFSSKTIIITSPRSPRETWCQRSEEDIGQLLRRIENVVHFPAITPWNTKVNSPLIVDLVDSPPSPMADTFNPPASLASVSSDH